MPTTVLVRHVIRHINRSTLIVHVLADAERIAHRYVDKGWGGGGGAGGMGGGTSPAVGTPPAERQTAG